MGVRPHRPHGRRLHASAADGRRDDLRWHRGPFRVDKLAARGQRRRQKASLGRDGGRHRGARQRRREPRRCSAVGPNLQGGPARMSTDPGSDYTRPPGEDRSVAEMVIDVSERVSILVREEIELAKAEVTEKISKLLRGGAVGLAAGIFVLMGLAMFMHAIAWLLDDIFFGNNIWIGFAIESLFWFVVAGIAGLVAYRSVQAGGTPRPA